MSATVVQPVQSVDLARIARALGISKRSAERRAIRLAWPYVEVDSNGGKKRLFTVSQLPEVVRAQLHRLEAETIVEKLNADDAAFRRLPQISATTAQLCGATEETEHTRAVRDARQAVRTAVLRLQEQAGCSLKCAVVTFLTQAQAGRLEASVASAVLSMARDGRGRKGTVQAAGFPSERSLFRWLAAGDLTPKKPQRDMRAKPWMWVAAELFARPQKPTLKWVHEQLAANWNTAWGESMVAPALEMQLAQVLPFAVTSHAALQPSTEPVATTPAAPVEKVDFSDLAMQLFGDDIETQDRAAEAARDARLKDLESFGQASEGRNHEGAGKKVAGD